tara:strand:- start:3746 stop:4045 length:300 start_codon:yes stop_codon:yes gene_type:complete
MPRPSKKCTIVRFKPHPHTWYEFLDALKERHTEEGYLMTKGDEIYAIVIREAEELEESAADGVAWLDKHRHLLQEYDDENKHTIPVTGDLVKVVGKNPK